MTEPADKQTTDAAVLLERDAKREPDPYPKANLADFDSAELLGEHLLIQRWSPQQESEGGIVLVEGSQEAPAAGWVLKTGQNVPAGAFCIGDTVLFLSHAIQALPDVKGTPASSKGWTKFNYLKYQDVVLRYPLAKAVATRAKANRAKNVLAAMGLEDSK